MLDNKLMLLAKDLNVYVHESVNAGFCLWDFIDHLQLYWCEGISHSAHAWKSALPGSLFICTLPWHHSEDLFNRVRLFLKKANPRLSPSNFIILCNSKDELKSALNAGWPNSCLCNQNAWLDEDLYSLLTTDEQDRKYDLVINCRPELWKRPHLATGVSNLAIIKGYNFRKSEYYNLDQLNPSYINQDRLDLKEVVSILNQSKVGGIFSAVEGACYSSSEYLLCGLPVISTKSHGGRDMYYTDLNSRIIEPDPQECRHALSDLLEALKSTPGIRSQIRERHLATSRGFRDAAFSLIDELLDVHGIAACARDLISSNYKNKMVRYSTLPG